MPAFLMAKLILIEIDEKDEDGTEFLYCQFFRDDGVYSEDELISNLDGMVAADHFDSYLIIPEEALDEVLPLSALFAHALHKTFNKDFPS